MQSLGQAVYRYVCRYPVGGIRRRDVVDEMASRGYLPPIEERVEGALEEYLTMNKIVFVKGCFVKKAPR